MDNEERETRPREIVHQRISLFSDGMEFSFYIESVLNQKREFCRTPS
jgi:hypothetical protein